MTHRHPVRFLASTPAALCACASSAVLAAPAAQATPADLGAFVKTLPTTGAHDRVFLTPVPDLQARLGIAPAVLRSVDPGIACDPGSKAPDASTATLGRVGTVLTVCTPGGASMSVLTLTDGSSYSTTCGAAGPQVHASIDVTVGEHSMRASTDAPASARAPTHSCTGWAKQPR